MGRSSLKVSKKLLNFTSWCIFQRCDGTWEWKQDFSPYFLHEYLWIAKLTWVRRRVKRKPWKFRDLEGKYRGEGQSAVRTSLQHAGRRISICVYQGLHYSKKDHENDCAHHFMEDLPGHIPDESRKSGQSTSSPTSVCLPLLMFRGLPDL